MILPTKHLGVRQSLIGAGSYVVRHLQRPRQIESLWKAVQAEGHIKSFNKLILVLDALYMLGIVEMRDKRIALVRRGAKP